MKQNVSESETVLSSKQKNIFQIPRPKQKKYFSDSSTQTKKKYFLNSPTQTKKIFFKFLDPNKKKYFLYSSTKQKKYFLNSSTQTKKKNVFQIPATKQGIFMTKSLLLFSAGRLFRQQKEGHGNETNVSKSETVLSSKQKNIFQIPRPKQKKNIFRFLDPNKKKIFLNSSTQTKKIFLDSSTQMKKKYFYIPRPKTKKIFLDSSTQTKKIFLCSSTQNKKKYFLDSSTKTKKKNIFIQPKKNIFMTNLAVVFCWSVVFSWSIVWSAESRSWKWNKMFRNQKQFYHPDKKNIFQISRLNKKKSFWIPRPKPNKKKNIFKFLDPNKNIFIFLEIFFRFLDPNKKNIFILPQPKQGIFYDQILAVVFQLLFSVGRIVSSAESRSWKWNKMFRNQKQFFHPNKKIFFRFLDPNKKKIFLDSSTQTKKIFLYSRNPNKAFSWPNPCCCFQLVVFSWSIVSSGRKVGHGNETKMVRNQKQFFHPNKKNIFQIPRPKQKNIFRFLDPNKKNTFRFLDPNKKNIFVFLETKKNILDSSTQTKKYFYIPATQTRHFHDQILAVVVFGWLFSVGRLFHQQEVGHGNETKCPSKIRNNSLIQTKNIFSDSSIRTKRIFSNSSTQNKKNIFQIPRPTTKNYFLHSSTQTKKIF